MGDSQAIDHTVKKQNSILRHSPEKILLISRAVEKDDFITVSEFTLKEVIRQTIFSIADSDTNKMMTGELFEIE